MQILFKYYIRLVSHVKLHSQQPIPSTTTTTLLVKKEFFQKMVKQLRTLQLLQISIYTLSDLGDLSNLIGSLSRTIQQYSPPSEWIMCELGVFPISLEKDLLKVDKTLG